MRTFFSVFWLIFILAASLAFGQTQPLWELKLNEPSKIWTADESNGQLEGPLPLGVHPNYFGWQKSKVQSRFIQKDGETYFRMTASNTIPSGPQFSVPVSKLEKGKFYRLTATVRNLAEGNFSLFLRENPDPYRTLSPSVTIKPSGVWETVSVFLQFDPPASGQYALYFTFSGDGVWDLKEFSISEAQPAEFQAQQQGLTQFQDVRRPDAHWKNFIFSSCFPFGVPAGWNCRRGTASISEDVTGPSGQPALKLAAGLGEKKNPQFFSAPFQTPDPQKKYTLSFSYRGPGKLTCNGNRFEPSETWKRASFNLQIPEFQAGAVLTFEADDTVFLDAIRLAEEGETDYKRAGNYEIALGLPDSDASVARVQFEDEPAKLRFRLMGDSVGDSVSDSAGDSAKNSAGDSAGDSIGDSAGVTIRGTVTNIWGETRSLPEIHPQSEVHQTTQNSQFIDGFIEYLLFPETPFGQFRIDVQAFRGSEPVSPVAEFVVSRFRRPIYWGKDAPESPFGIHEEPILPLLTGLKAGGINWVRLHDGGFQYCNWPAIEEEKGKWTFHDTEIKAYRDAGMMLYGQLGGAPTWASYYANSEFKPDGYRKFFSAPTDEHLGDFENYAYQIVKHHEKEIQDWFVWNEPWGGGFFHCGYDTERQCYLPFKNQGAAYAKVLKAAYLGAKRANPNVRITGFATYGSATEFTTQIVEAGGYEYCDELDYHEYIPRTFGFPGDGNLQNLEQAFAPVTEKYGPIQKKIIMSEGSPLSNGSDRGLPLQGIYAEILPWKNQDLYNPDEVTRFTMSLLTCGVKRVFLYTAHGHTNLTKSSFQLLLGADGYPHPTLAALSNFARHSENSRFVKYQELCRNVYAAVFQKNDGSSFAVITGKRQARAEIHCTAKNAHAEDLYGNPLTFPMTYNGYLNYVTIDASADVLLQGLSGKTIPLER